MTTPAVLFRCVHNAADPGWPPAVAVLDVDVEPALTRGSLVVETGVDPVTFRFSGGRSAD